MQVIVVNRITDPQLQQIEGEAVAAVAAAAQLGEVQRIQVITFYPAVQQLALLSGKVMFGRAASQQCNPVFFV